MALKLSSDQLQAIQFHADRAYPNECCGLLLGHMETADTVVVTVRPVENSWSEEVADLADRALTPARRYWIAPEEMLAAMREARDRHLGVIGIYHSHPDYPAVPSECDRALAWPHYSYVIVSVQQGKSEDCRSWVLDDRHQFQPQPLCITAPAFP